MVTKSKSTDATLIEGWLREIQIEPRRATDPTANWRYEIELPPGSPNQVSVLNPKKPARAVVIACTMQLAPLHIAAYEGLDNDQRKEFVFDLQKTLIRDYVEHQLQGLKDPLVLTCPTGVQLVSVIFDDGLSLDVLAFRLACMSKAQAASSLCVNKHLGPDIGSGGSGQFEFRRLGSIQ